MVDWKAERSCQQWLLDPSHASFVRRDSAISMRGFILLYALNIGARL